MLIFKDESYSIMGCAFEVYKTLSHGFLEAVYQEAFELELKERNIPYLREVELPIFYKNKKLEKTYRADFVCFGKIIVELKAVRELDKDNISQVYNYLSATGFQLGLLLNFGHYSNLEWQRIVKTDNIE